MKKVKINNFRNVKNIEFEPRHITVFTGPTGSGKTTVLEAVRLGVSGSIAPDDISYGEKKSSVCVELGTGVVVEKSRTASSATAATGTWTKRTKSNLGAVNKYIADQLAVPESALQAMSGVRYFAGMKGSDIGKLLYSILPTTMSADDAKKLADFLIVLSKEEEEIMDRAFAGMSAIGDPELKKAHQTVFDERKLLNREIKELTAIANTAVPDVSETAEELHDGLMNLGAREEAARTYARRMAEYNKLVLARNNILASRQNILAQLVTLKGVTEPDMAAEQNIRAELVKYRDEYLPKLLEAIAAIETGIPRDRMQIEAMKAHTCPINPAIHCTTDMSVNISRGEAVIAEANARLQKYRTDVNQLRTLIANREKQIDDIAKLKLNWQRKAYMEEQLRNLIVPDEPTAPEPVDVGNVQAEKAAIDGKLKAIALKDKVAQAKKDLEAKKDALVHYERVLSALDPKGGIRNVQLRKILSPLQAKCQEKADKFRPGFKIEFRCDDDFEVVIETHPGSGFRSIETASTGEFLFVSYMLMSVISMVTNPKFMLLDGLDALDAETLKGFVELLNADTAVENIFITAVNHPDTLDVINSIAGVKVVEL